MRSARVMAVSFAMAATTLASAYPPFWKTFSDVYHPAAGTAIGDGKCLTCHTGPQGGIRNPFGKDLEKVIGSGTLTEAILREVEQKDSDGDGVSNLEEINSGTLPGDPGSKPAGASASASPKGQQVGLIPQHVFHPALVHFPIALFLFGGFLELLGLSQRSEKVREVARWNLLAGALAAWIAVPTGFLAAFRLGYGVGADSAALTHLLLALTATMLMTGVAAARRNHAPKGGLYVVGLILAMTFVAVAGHFGSVLVYG